MANNCTMRKLICTMGCCVGVTVQLDHVIYCTISMSLGGLLLK
jgi:hypothetical protein